MSEYERGYAQAIRDIAAYLEGLGRAGNIALTEAVKEHRLNPSHGEGEYQSRRADELFSLAKGIRDSVMGGHAVHVKRSSG